MNQTQDLQALYRQTVLDHSRQPRNFSRLASADRTAVGHNALCGDKITVYLKLQDEKIEDISFEACGCAISMASASIMTESVKHLGISAALQAAESTMSAFDGCREDRPVEGEMAALDSVRQYPSRIKCATLPWKTLVSALTNSKETATTED